MIITQIVTYTILIFVVLGFCSILRYFKNELTLVGIVAAIVAVLTIIYSIVTGQFPFANLITAIFSHGILAPIAVMFGIIGITAGIAVKIGEHTGRFGRESEWYEGNYQQGYDTKNSYLYPILQATKFGATILMIIFCVAYRLSI